jgi:hypothetical protein
MMPIASRQIPRNAQRKLLISHDPVFLFLSSIKIKTQVTMLRKARRS